MQIRLSLDILNKNAFFNMQQYDFTKGKGTLKGSLPQM